MFGNKLLLGPLFFFTLIDMYYCDKRRVTRQAGPQKSTVIFGNALAAPIFFFCLDADSFDAQRENRFICNAIPKLLIVHHTGAHGCQYANVQLCSETIQLLNDGHSTSSLICMQLMSADQP